MKMWISFQRICVLFICRARRVSRRRPPLVVPQQTPRAPNWESVS